MRSHRAFVALGSNEGEPRANLERALADLEDDDTRVAACSRLAWSAYEGEADAPRVLNAVAEVCTRLDADALHARLHDLEAAHGRVRDGRATRALDLDLLAFDDLVRADPDLTLPHPRCLRRPFVLGPWEEIAPCVRVPGTDRTVVEHAAALHPALPAAVEPAWPAPFAARTGDFEVLADRAALDAWTARHPGAGVVMTMGALHAGHASLVQRAAAECEHVLATIFVNPTQFAPGEDLARYPRTFEADCALLRRHGAGAVYAPAVEDLYPDGVAADVEPGPAAAGYEGARRPTHFAGVATVVTRLWRRTRAARSYFGRKDAQQLAVLGEVRAREGIDVEIVACPTVRAVEGLALSSRNRYLDDAQQRLARGLSAALEGAWCAAAAGRREPAAWLPAAREDLRARGLAVEYLDVVDASTFQPLAVLQGPALAVGAVRVGDVRLIDNRWIAPPAEAA